MERDDLGSEHKRSRRQKKRNESIKKDPKKLKIANKTAENFVSPRASFDEFTRTELK